MKVSDRLKMPLCKIYPDLYSTDRGSRPGEWVTTTTTYKDVTEDEKHLANALLVTYKKEKDTGYSCLCCNKEWQYPSSESHQSYCPVLIAQRVTSKKEEDSP